MHSVELQSIIQAIFSTPRAEFSFEILIDLHRTFSSLGDYFLMDSRACLTAVFSKHERTTTQRNSNTAPSTNNCARWRHVKGKYKRRSERIWKK